MKLHRFYVEQNLPKEGIFSIHHQGLFSQIKKVLRLLPNEKVGLFNGNSQEYISKIVSSGNKNEIVFQIEEIQKNDVSLNKEVSLFFSILKKDNVEWIIQKGTELGVSNFIPIISARSEKKNINIDRINKITIEATEQSGRPVPPTIKEITKLESIFDSFHEPIIVFEKGSEPFKKEDFENAIKVGILIGPEGGWTKEEISLFKNRKATFRSLGSTTLRGETAAIVASALFLQCPTL